MCHFLCAADEPGGGDKPSDDKRKEQTTPVVSPSQGSPEAKEERYEMIIPFKCHELQRNKCLLYRGINGKNTSDGFLNLLFYVGADQSCCLVLIPQQLQ